MKNTYSSKEFFLKKYFSKPKIFLFRLLTKNSLPIFVRGSDGISADPLIFGNYETRIRDLINFYAKNGYGDYLIDVGANIGLSACQSGNLFKEVHCYEPNQDCFNILKVNTKIMLSKPRLILNNFGLGKKKSVANLYVPKDNWGGGFIYDENNSYSEAEIANKDGTKYFDPNNYNIMPIKVESGVERLADVFQGFQMSGLRKGVIKIDAEGYEQVIIQAIAASIPSNISALLIFECFLKQFDPAHLLKLFNGRAKAYRLVRMPEKYISKIKRVVQIVCQMGYHYSIKEFDSKSNSSDLIFIIDPIN
jgi:FkbM family methyltransferase